MKEIQLRQIYNYNLGSKAKYQYNPSQMEISNSQAVNWNMFPMMEINLMASN